MVQAGVVRLDCYRVATKAASRYDMFEPIANAKRIGDSETPRRNGRRDVSGWPWGWISAERLG